MVAGKQRGGEAAERLVAARGLTKSDLKAIAALEERVLGADGGRLKLEWSALRSRPEDEVRDLLFWNGGELVGFLGIYAFGQNQRELAGMVDPWARRQRIGTALINAGLCVLREQGQTGALLVVPRNAGGGAELAQSRGAQLDHSEHAMRLNGPPAPGPENPRLSVRLGEASDVPALIQILMDGFGHTMLGDSDPVFATPTTRRLTAVLDGRVVGTLRASLEGGRGTIHGFAIAADLQGQGLGRDVLRRACSDLQQRGAARVELEVLTDNDHALGLYESLGFERIITEDYYELKV